jgi:hypothetical protein
VGSLKDTAALRQVLLCLLQSSNVITIPAILHIHSFTHSFITDAIQSWQTKALLTNIFKRKKEATGETDVP